MCVFIYLLCLYKQTNSETTQTKKEGKTMTNYDNAHSFFYGSSNRDKYYENTSYDDKCFYSYYTIIGLKTNNINTNEQILLISYNSMSRTTNRHIAQLRSACPYNTVKAIFNYGESYTSSKTLVNNLKNYIDNAAEKLTLKANRQDFITLYKMAETYLNLEYFQEQNILQQINEIINTHTETYKILTLDFNNFKKQLKQREAEKRKQLKEKVNHILTKYDYYTLIKELFIPYSFTLQRNTTEITDNKKDLMTILNPKKQYSFIAYDSVNENIKTSQHITISIDKVKPFLKLWKAGKLKHGMKIDIYTVLSVSEKYIQVGCHKIPTKNLNYVYDDVFKVQTKIM